jgi:hypothetical protein
MHCKYSNLIYFIFTLPGFINARCVVGQSRMWLLFSNILLFHNIFKSRKRKCLIITPWPWFKLYCVFQVLWWDCMAHQLQDLAWSSQMWIWSCVSLPIRVVHKDLQVHMNSLPVKKFIGKHKASHPLHIEGKSWVCHCPFHERIWGE